ncbi:DNA-directed RNA polymerase subunit beta [Rummeliibacillus suwonensis]|jgi:DNA-directed RNA polymerase subunit beta.|uniref:DNA-directed RNA polymerase subunit beta n=1 Tax=Rummeliibacillus suwonensis TaxID=1306154 RepID=UPI0011B47AA2|nr:DNA-directed RNA polymerase subunit beta [Rummeliibacillus suwonensis]MBO2535481.1 DNA-directed RNA polymerase subunit beta [Rummeliibacillus suwonensis]
MANNSTEKKTENQSSPRTRQEAKQNRKVVNERVGRNWMTTGIFSIGFKLIIVVVLLVVVAITGSMVGYSIIGNGKPLAVFNPSTWQHVFDIMNGK